MPSSYFPKTSRFPRLKAISLALILLFLNPANSDAYSVLSHEAVVDSAWDDAIKPLLLKRFPDSTPEQLKEAHSYAYGGSVIQDLGYYPFGSPDPELRNPRNSG